MAPLLGYSLFLLFVSTIYFGEAKDSICVGAFFDEEQQKTPLNWGVIEDNLHEDIEFQAPEIISVSENEIFDATVALCEFINNDQRLVAVFGPRSHILSTALESTCAYLGVPYFITSWMPKTNLPFDNVFNLYPDTDLLIQGYAKIVESFDWHSIAVLYEDDDGLVRLQDVLKLQKFHKEEMNNEIFMQKLSSNWDNRSILKLIRNSPFNRIIIDCKRSRIIDILQQAQEVKLLSDFSTSIFLTSLDAHTLDYSSLYILANITTVRLFDPMKPNFQRIIEEDFADMNPAKISVETALLYDAMTLITEAVNHLKTKDVDISSRYLYCLSPSIYSDDIELIPTIQEIQLMDTLTGPISLKNGKREKFTLDVIEINKPDKPIGIWDSEYPEKMHLTRNATEREAELRRRMENYNFIVTSRIGRPYLYKRDDPDAYGNARYYGYSVDLITEIAKIINITFEFRITEDNSYVNLVNDLIERRADLGICDFTITPQRRAVIDFSMPFMTLGIGILHKESSSGEVDNMYAFMRPISWTVWFYIWTLNLLISIAMFFVARLAPREWENPKPWDEESRELENIWTIKNFLWLTLGSITTQGCDILPKSTPTRTIAGFWWFFSLIITSSYTANLAAFLTMGKIDVTVDSVEELAAQSKIKYGMLEKGSTETFFANSNNSLYQKMWNTIKHDKSVFEKNNDNGVERVLSTKNALYAFFMESTGIEFEMERRCELRRIGNLLDSKSYGIGMPLNADYRHSINSAILQLQETGKLMDLKEKWWKREREGEPCNRSSDEKSDSLALSNVGGIFIVLGLGIAIACTIAIFEFFWEVRRVAVEEHISFMEALKCEAKFACKIFIKKKRAKPVPSESSSSNSEDKDKITLARSLFAKSVSLLNIANESNDNDLRNRNTMRGIQFNKSGSEKN
ncbi:glutamate receptor ionotropic, kainate 2-like [Sitophilus oryzae]|uniref:Glutamate receptor ionotropic, kainate 2-like n=1 Tax=Sitophilus oryzae TaxID=7048 RepID=A0A6J2X5I7_SITOR|nr:glutamate receptor ionotropic, kainate 2-like [Sitophilus oryzae]